MRTVWRYNSDVKGPQLKKYRHFWELSAFEVAEMKNKWAERQRVGVKHTRNSRLLALVISETHRSQIPCSNLFYMERVHIHLFQLW
jgi:hypothetical protein